MRFNWSTSNLFIAAAVPAVIALFAVLAFWRLGSLPATARSVASLKPSAS